jgi:hypothetical protein
MEIRVQVCDSLFIVVAPNNGRSIDGGCNSLPGYGQILNEARFLSNAIPPNKLPIPWLRGIVIHAAFTLNVRNIPNVSVNQAYKDGQISKWHAEGSVRPDAIYGDINSPLYIIELKTGNARLVDPQLANYIKHLPEPTRICEIFERQK